MSPLLNSEKYICIFRRKKIENKKCKGGVFANSFTIYCDLASFSLDLDLTPSPTVKQQVDITFDFFFF